MIDREALLAWLDSAAEQRRNPLVQAIYEGLAGRIRCGDFDMREEE